MTYRTLCKVGPAALLIVGLVSFQACKKKQIEPKGKVPTVTTDSISNATSTSADVSGSVGFDNGLEVTDRGICWGTSPSPTINDKKVSGGTGMGDFTCKITNLVKNTKYYIRAYATNSAGTGYGNEQTLTPGTVKDIDGNVYSLVSISGTVWIAENLRVTHYQNGDPIPLVSANAAWKSLSSGAYAYVNNSAANTADFGLLYNYYAAFDSRNICPKGYTGIVAYGYNSLRSHFLGGNAGGKLRDTGYKYWSAPNITATNISGFSGRGTGYRDTSGTYLEFKKVSYFWEEEIGVGFGTFPPVLMFDNDDFQTHYKLFDKRSGMCVRCIQK